ncbi:MAG TPA: hypothetical protein VMU89_17395 [Thermomicrobiaceae bacterium]|nr:hypothetical protein [Thermomicrobiaceae bacterium]
MTPDEADLTGHVGPIEVDWPRSAGYFGGIALATALGMVEPPLALFIAAIPFFKLLNQPSVPRPLRVVTHFLDGMAKPVGGEAEATLWLAKPEANRRSRPSILSEARVVAAEFRTRRQSGNGIVEG